MQWWADTFQQCNERKSIPIIDRWDLVNWKDKLSKTRWKVSRIGRLNETLLDVMTNKIMWWGHMATILLLKPQFFDILI